MPTDRPTTVETLEARVVITSRERDPHAADQQILEALTSFVSDPDQPILVGSTGPGGAKIEVFLVPGET